MIKTIFLANLIEEQLNLNTQGVDFLIFADEGDLRQTRKIGARTESFVHGLVEVTSSNLFPLRNIAFSTINLQLMILAPINDEGFVKEGEKQRKQSRSLLEIKECLNEMLERLNGQSMPITIEDKTYNLTIGMSLATDGQKMPFGEMSDCLPLYMNISLNFFENGVNANDCHIILNGEDLYFTRAVITKIKTADQNEFATTKGGKTAILVGGKSIDLTLPAVTSEVNRMIMNNILEEEENKAVALRIETPLGNKNIIGVLGTNSVSMDAGANLGFNLSIVEGVDYLLDYDTNWQESNEIGANITKNLLSKGIVYWGDGTSDYLNASGSVTHDYADGETEHIVRIYGGK